MLMRKLSKIKLQEAVILEDREMKMIYGGSGDNNADCTELAFIVGAECWGIVNDKLTKGYCSSGVLVPGDSSCACVF